MLKELTQYYIKSKHSPITCLGMFLRYWGNSIWLTDFLNLDSMLIYSVSIWCTKDAWHGPAIAALQHVTCDTSLLWQIEAASLKELQGSLEGSVAQLQQNLNQRDADGSKMTLQVQVSCRCRLFVTELLQHLNEAIMPLAPLARRTHLVLVLSAWWSVRKGCKL